MGSTPVGISASRGAAVTIKVIGSKVSGKTTICKLIADTLNANGFTCFLVEPGCTDAGIRRVCEGHLHPVVIDEVDTSLGRALKKPHSFTDDKGQRWTACCECNRGGNGNDPDKCSCGWQAKHWDHQGCYLGEAIHG